MRSVLNVSFALACLDMGVASANVDIVSPLSLVKSPMVLLAIVALGLMFVMPMLMENSMSTCSVE
jgi:hypothetical protein